MTQTRRQKRMKPARISRVVITALKIVGAASLLYYALLIPYLGISMGFQLVWLALGGACLALAWLIGRIPVKKRRVQARISWCAAIAALLAAALFIAVAAPVVGASFSVPENGADYMLVLGARVKDDGPSVLLQFRIEKAAEYLMKNEHTVAILCGGQGDNEPMSEALAMYEGLVALGVDESRLIMEDQSTSTEENIRFAKAYMDGGDKTVVITTTGYHLYRALNYAREQGLEEVSGNPARCAMITPLNYYTREVVALLRDWAVSVLKG